MSLQGRRTFAKLFASAGLVGTALKPQKRLRKPPTTLSWFVSPHAKEWDTFKPQPTKLETLLIQPRWLFLKIHTDEGIIGLGEPITEGRAKPVPPPLPKWLLT